MPHRFFLSLFALAFSCVIPTSLVQAQATPPVNPNTSEEARDLLKFINSVRGKYIISGHHNYNHGDMNRFSDEVEKIVGKRPALWGTDFITHTKDNAGQRVVDEAIAKYKEGYIVTLMWHMGRPYDTPPKEFRTSVQVHVTDEEWSEIVTPGTELYALWEAEVDVVAGYLKQLQAAKVPVLWRPFHEMNGPWFWWGDKRGEDGFVKLWKNFYHRLVDHHKIDNLVWVWNANSPRDLPDGEKYDAFAFADYFPGLDYCDILATDAYNNDWAQSHYDDLLALAGGKPITIGECGRAPTPEILTAQPDWAWFMIWSNWITTHNEPEDVKRLYADPRVLTHDEISASPGYQVSKEL